MRFANQKDACGTGFVARLDGRAHHSILTMALQALANHAHRGAQGADRLTGDGAGVSTQIPFAFLRRACAPLFPMPDKAEDLAVAMVFLPLTHSGQRSAARRILEESLRQHGARPLGWREVPLNLEAIGPRALSSRPHIQQLMVERHNIPLDRFEATLYRARRRAERQAREAAIEGFYVASLSCRTLVYKGLCMADQLGRFYPDLQQPDYETAVALFHQRYSTNTVPAWALAQPFRMICHNGEFNTLQGNWNWIRARETALHISGLDRDVEDLIPIISPGVSDSGAFDNVLEFFHRNGRELLPSLTMMVPEIWENVPEGDMPAHWRDLYSYLSCLMEPWDGPAAVCFFDGLRVGTLLDRNGLRPMRYTVMRDGLVVAASEAGCVQLDDAQVVKRGMLGPGEILLVDTQEQKLLTNHDIKERLSRRHPYHDWLAQRVVPLPAEALRNVEAALDPLQGPIKLDKRQVLLARQRVFGYTHEDEVTVLRPMISSGQEPVGSMGDDTPPAVLSRIQRPLFHFFRQRFAQVTNPAIDPLREQMVMSVRTLLGRRPNVLTEAPEVTRLLELPGPILSSGAFEHLLNQNPRHFPNIVLRPVWPVQSGSQALEQCLELICDEAEQAVRHGANIVVLYDGDVNPFRAPIPSLLVTSAVHHRLVATGLRLSASIVVASGEPREVHHFACLLGYGADAIYPYLALETIQDIREAGEDSQLNFIRAVEKGLLKIMAKMGISLLSSYRAGQVFEILGLDQQLVERYFPNTPSVLGGARLEEIARDISTWHQQAYESESPSKLSSYGFYKYKKDGEAHRFAPAVVKAMHQMVQAGSQALKSQANPFEVFAHEVPGYDAYLASLALSPISLRDLLGFVQHRQPLELDQVESLQSIVRRFSTGAMSHGSLSLEAHETLARALNQLGACSNSGEGGEDPSRFVGHANSKIKQVASGRFGVTPGYLLSAQELQIKMAQGSKPGEGGQIPGHKVTEEIARIRHTRPGVTLISPPPHHDIYSIEDLSQLIHDLKRIHPEAAISVKLVSEDGVGTVAAGVAKGFADIIQVSGCEGGTGASPLSSIKFAGMPWELGLAQVQQTLIANGLREKVRLRVDGGLVSGRDVMVAAVLGADEFSFGTSALLAEGCLMARSCHNNKCPVGIASQAAELRAKFPGTPEGVITYLLGVAHEVRHWLARLGVRSLGEIIGRSEFLEQVVTGPEAHFLDLSGLLWRPRDDMSRHHGGERNQAGMRGRDLDQEIIEQLQRQPELPRTLGPLDIYNTDRTLGARLTHYLLRQYGISGHGSALPEGSLKLKLRGSAGQSFGAFGTAALHLELEGQANDYVGKGLQGGEIVLKPFAASQQLPSEQNWIAGNTALYGATGGTLWAAGRVGMRFAVRNSGATAVVEGTGEHACEYMTGGSVVVLGSVGRNFGAGMTGGLAYVYDVADDLRAKLNQESVAAETLNDSDLKRLEQLLRQHLERTGSNQAQRILRDWNHEQQRFLKVSPLAQVQPAPTPQAVLSATPA